MNIHPDFEELLRLLEENNVEYMIVGGYAVAFHGHPRFTKDIGVFYLASGDNVVRLRAALLAFGFTAGELPTEAFCDPANVLTFGAAPSRVDLLSKIDGVNFHDAKNSVVRGRYGTVEVTFIGRDDLIRNKQSTKRTRDKADVEELTQSDDSPNDPFDEQRQ